MQPYYDDGTVTIYHGDCREVLPSLPPADLVLTDPPYGIGNRWSRRAMVGRNGASRLWGRGETWDEDTPSAETMQAVIASGRDAVVWGGNYFGIPVPARCWLVWDKMQAFTGADAELAWTTFDAPVRVFRLSRVEAFGAGNATGVVKQHPTQKPLELMRWCLGFAPEAQTVLDPFMGSGTTLRAAKDMGRRAVGIELDESYCELAARRCSQEVLALA